MKSRVIIFVLLSLRLFGQKPEKIYRINLQPHEQDYYNTQSLLWKQEVTKNPKDASAWENYYWATRYGNQMYLRNRSADKEKIMKDIVLEMETNVPNTIEYYRCRLSVDDHPNGDTISRLKLIKKALELNPDDWEILEMYITYCEINGRNEKLTNLNTRLYNTKTYAFGIMEQDYNILMSADKNAILFTGGDNDTYPVWMLQRVKGIRTDITVINIPLAIQYPGMLKRLLKEKNIVLPDDFFEKSKSAKSEMDFIKELVLQINKHYPRVPVCFAATCDVENTFPDSLYCTGLAWRFSEVRIDNLAMLKSNIENYFHLDYLDDGLYDNGISEELVQECNELYITPFSLLYKYEKEKGEPGEKMKFYKNFVLKYAAHIGKENKMEKYLEQK